MKNVNEYRTEIPYKDVEIIKFKDLEDKQIVIHEAVLGSSQYGDCVYLLISVGKSPKKLSTMTSGVVVMDTIKKVIAARGFPVTAKIVMVKDYYEFG